MQVYYITESPDKGNLLFLVVLASLPLHLTASLYEKAS